MDPKLLEWLASVSGDPLAFVLGGFPWGEKDTSLEFESGPEPWQRDILNLIRNGLPIDRAIKIAVASGHGIGKTTLVSWIILWGFTTLPDTRGRVTAGTETQLKTVTWAELGKWFNLFIGRAHFQLNATTLLSRDPERERTWRIDMVPWSENNPQAFAGMHNKGRRIIYIFDEGSAISDIIYETAEGALTDSGTQIVWAVFGNPTRNSGRFRELFPGQRYNSGWVTRNIDSRTISFTNKADIAEKITLNGEDSDYVRIRVTGQFPCRGEVEFISSGDVEEASHREALSQKLDPLVIGVDVARYGSNESVIFFRKGRDARSIAPLRYRGLGTVELAARVSDVFHQYRVDAIFVDGGGVGGGVVDNLRALHLFCFDINFGSKSEGTGFASGSDGERYANKRAEMWGSMRAWLKAGAIPDLPDLKAQLIGPTYGFNIKNQIQLEKKEDMMKRGLESPDLADALALTFAYPVAAHAAAGGDFPHPPLVQTEWDPFDAKRMAA